MAFCNQSPARKAAKGKGSVKPLCGEEAANRPRRLRQTALGSERSLSLPPGFNEEVQVGKTAPVDNIPFTNIYSSGGSSMPEYIVSFVETEDRFKRIGPIGPVRSVKLCKGNPIWDSKCGVVCVADPSGRGSAYTRHRTSRWARDGRRWSSWWQGNGRATRSMSCGSRRHCLGCSLLPRSSQR